ncbi:hypothetical protein EMIHUDRAFT_458113 [Emiliania huxleyi CCMP1516]|uniref:O-fucosyltransferase family protein n=2 Tax=Emiliania huxleyi TaxID=2903 RepID=A0A0D3JGF6_EMIH1|nr:hypothetical protein EMIHUDRAFT_458113 [Emiliania huxleyi CCMP1516]EOD22591.1 hypothetical protein EMIHUDRAFT_458113 [Emiliania huxleyi CCMP1516]|eukprot:XP_005775020.1 hypothetical protein EMIHUDRAFT_458113 [Emiliania huxleyi CCMP1516]
MHCLNALRRLVSLCCLAACVAASDEACEAPMTLSSFAHALNEKFIAKVGEGRAREFRPELLPARVADSSLELHLVEPSSERFFTYASDNGWNNQLLNLLCGLDMARSLNRTLIVPPFSWPRRRGPAKPCHAPPPTRRQGERLPAGRRGEAGGGARRRGSCGEDEHGGVLGSLGALGVAAEHISGEGQPHRKRKVHRWSREGWVGRWGASSAPLLAVSCCLFWTWRLPDEVAFELYSHFEYHPALAAPLGDEYAAMHVRRGDKVSVDVAYRDSFPRMGPDYFLRPAAHQMRNTCPCTLRAFGGATVFVATDELDRAWFAPLREQGGSALRRPRGFGLRFADDLDRAPLLEALSSFPQAAVWADVLAILEQDWVRGGLVGDGEPLPCVAREPWC